MDRALLGGHHAGCGRWHLHRTELRSTSNAPGDFATGKRSHLRNTDQSRLERWGKSQGAANLRPEQSSTCLINSTKLTVTSLERISSPPAGSSHLLPSINASTVQQARTQQKYTLPAATEQHLQLCHAGSKAGARPCRQLAVRVRVL